ncbi:MULTISPECIES: HAD-IA family hydrolase [unclassified Pseudonocardia]|uniref:HAD family hydrolase n=1 Tax=unclassified Pseudonocardia TaxID=2619320 RepID=UPI0001FFF0CE|nr:HAD-IA family hydrolase [Pseudonocardia sp. Ae707_Ps1]OLM19882.1 2-haloalkanoic acid dehalogenase [Pseudonocardia sp. Ae707_Ps1]
MTRVRALSFDVVGTLIDFETGILDCVRRQGVTAPDEQVLAEFAAAEDVQQHRTPEMPFTQMLDPISERLGLPDPAALRASLPGWPAFPDAAGTLARLGHRFRLVALTNADRAGTLAMARTLGDPFDDVVTVSDVGVNKPDPQMFAWMLGRLDLAGISRGELLHVAQSRYHDVGTAHRLGIRTCWVERRRGRAGTGATPAPPSAVAPDLHVGDLTELGELRELS